MSNRPNPERIAQLRTALGALPRATFAHLPTPLDACPRMATDLGIGALWIKRDDATGIALGGNKARQLEYILGHAMARGHDCVIQGAASQSNHARQLAAAGARLGLDVYLTPWQDARSHPIQGNYLLSHLFGAHIHPIPAGASSKDAKAALADRLRAEGRNPYVVGMGASDALVLAAVAYVDAFVEILDQLPGGKVPDWIFTTSQGSTQAGLLAAARILDLSTRVIGVNPLGSTHEAFTPVDTIRDMVHTAARHVGFDLEVEPDDVVNRAEYVGTGYGIPSQAGLAALDRLARREGILLDPVYSSKGFSGLVDAAEQGTLAPDATVVFVHTGGLPGVFAYADDLVAAVGASA